jgi:sugar phosphate isomerase/epimerase
MSAASATRQNARRERGQFEGAMGNVDLIASYWTIAGKLKFADGMDLEGSSIDFAQRVQAAIGGGYAGVGLTYPDLKRTAARYGYDGIRSILRDSGAKIFEVEFLTDWFADGERRRQSDAIRRELLLAAEKTGARHIKIGGDMEGKSWPVDQVVRSFAGLCDDAKNAGTNVVLEILPWSNIPDLKGGIEVVSGADKSNGALLVDIWHMARGGISYDEVASLPRRFLGHVELSDAAPQPIGTLIEDTVNHRRLCGEGSFDVPAFVRSVKATGYDGPFGVEIISEEQRNRTLKDAVNRSFAATMAQFAGIYT